MVVFPEREEKRTSQSVSWTT